MRTFTFIFSILLLTISCNNNKKQTLAAEVVIEDVPTHYDVDTTPPSKGAKYKGKRGVNPDNPPVIIDLTKSNPKKKFLYDDYYDTVEYLTIKLPDEIGRKFGDRIDGILNVTDKYIIAHGADGIGLPAIYCFDRQGKYLYRIKRQDKPIIREDGIVKNVGMVSSKRLNIITVVDENCIFMTINATPDREETYTHFLNLPTGKIYSTRDYGLSQSYMIDSTTMAMYEYNNRGFHDRFLSTIDIKGDTLSVFKSYNPVAKEEPRSGGAGSEWQYNLIYYFNNQLTIRQQYNDTIFRIISDKEIRPAYIIKTGDKKMTPYIAMYGNSGSKIKIRNISESEFFLKVNYRDDGIENTAFYDKLTKELYIDYSVSNDEGNKISIPGALRFNFLPKPIVSDDIVFTGYTTQNFQYMHKIIKDYSGYSDAHEELIDHYSRKIAGDECLLMILKKKGGK